MMHLDMFRREAVACLAANLYGSISDFCFCQADELLANLAPSGNNLLLSLNGDRQKPRRPQKNANGRPTYRRAISMLSGVAIHC